jgi:hypothetical protein
LEAPAHGLATPGGLWQARVGRPCVNLFGAQVVEVKTVSGIVRPRRFPLARRVACILRKERAIISLKLIHSHAPGNANR